METARGIPVILESGSDKVVNDTDIFNEVESYNMVPHEIHRFQNVVGKIDYGTRLKGSCVQITKPS